jgi:hypothetical protein
MRGKLAGASQGRSVRFFTTIMQIMFSLLSSKEKKKQKTEWQTFRSISKHVFFTLSRSKVVSMQNLGQSLYRTSEKTCKYACKQAKKKERKQRSESRGVLLRNLQKANEAAEVV